MKGLLLKDLYMMNKYCRSFLLFCIVFFGLSFAGDENMFLVFYPCLLAGMIPVTLLSYDERSGWNQYSQTLPYTKSQIVSAKYLMGLIIQVFVLALTAIIQGVKMNMSNTFILSDYLLMLCVLLILSLVASSVSLPFMFKLGVEKGRFAYYVMIGVVCGGSVIASNIFQEGVQKLPAMQTALPIICGVGIGIYALSWYLSVVFYQKR